MECYILRKLRYVALAIKYDILWFQAAYFTYLQVLLTFNSRFQYQ